MKRGSKIHLATMDSCTGCSTCTSVCPTKSITMCEDKEGFMQPQIDAETCIECHKCEKTCPIVTPIEIPADFETQAYAAINNDEEVRMRSSSGGVFYALAKWTIEQVGVVFGARFNEQWEVVHDYTETLEGIEPFMRSKYVQSRIGDTFKQAKQFLEQGRIVLYVGTPCQIGGLKAFLYKEYNNLITVDFICHGVPSPKVWREYLKWKTKGDRILNINFRDKENGWLCFQQITTTTTAATRENQTENEYFAGFLKNSFLRRSCFECSFRSYHRSSDITIADYWGVNELCPKLFDNKGTSIIFVHSLKGNKILRELKDNLILQPQDKANAILYNQGMEVNETMPNSRRRFFFLFQILPYRYVYYTAYKDLLIIRVVRKINKLLNRFLQE